MNLKKSWRGRAIWKGKMELHCNVMCYFHLYPYNHIMRESEQGDSENRFGEGGVGNVEGEEKGDRGKRSDEGRLWEPGIFE